MAPDDSDTDPIDPDVRRRWQQLADEVREHLAIAVAYDQEVGQPSDTLTLALTA